MADRFFEEETEANVEPLVINEQPRPTGAIIEQNALRRSPDLAPAPGTNVEAFAEGAPTRSPLERSAAPEKAFVPETPAAEYQSPFQAAPIPAARFDQASPFTQSTPIAGPNPALLDAADQALRPAPTPFIPHRMYEDPRLEAQAQEQGQRAAERARRDHERKQREILRGLKDQGVELETDFATGQTRPKRDRNGRVLFKPGIISPLEQDEDGSYYSLRRDQYGNEHKAPIKPKIDKKSGHRYVMGSDGVSKIDLGPDEEYIMRRDARAAQEIATNATQNAKAIKEQLDTITEEHASLANRAVELARLRNPTDDQRVELERLRSQAAIKERQRDQIEKQYNQFNQEAISAREESLRRRTAVVDRVRARYGKQSFTPESNQLVDAFSNPSPAARAEALKPETADRYQQMLGGKGTESDLARLAAVEEQNPNLLPQAAEIIRQARGAGQPQESPAQAAMRAAEQQPLDFFDKLKDIKDNPSQLVPFLAGAADIMEMGELGMAAYRITQAGKDGVEPTQEDIALIKEYQEHQQRDSTFAYKVASVLAMLPSFAGELYLTSGIGTAARLGALKAGREALERLGTKAGAEILERVSNRVAAKAAGETVENVLGRTAAEKGAEFAARAASTIVGAAAQSVPAAGLRMTAGTIENMLPTLNFTENEKKELVAVIEEEGDDFAEAAVKAFGDNFIEVMSEQSGGALAFIPGANKLKMIKAALAKRWFNINPDAPAGAFTKIVRGAGWNGVLGEMAEERFGDVARSAVGLQSWSDAVPSAEQLMVEAVAFMIPGAAINATNALINRQREAGDPLPGTETPPPTLEAAEMMAVIRADMEGQRDLLQAEVDDASTTAERKAEALREIAQIEADLQDLPAVPAEGDQLQEERAQIREQGADLSEEGRTRLQEIDARLEQIGAESVAEQPQAQEQGVAEQEQPLTPPVTEQGEPTQDGVVNQGAAQEEGSATQEPVVDRLREQREAARLPRDLAGAQPRYKSTTLMFSNDVDKAAYIIAQEKPSKRDADYLRFLMESTGMDETVAREYGQEVRQAVAAAHGRASNATHLAIPSQWDRPSADTTAAGERTATPPPAQSPAKKVKKPSKAALNEAVKKIRAADKRTQATKSVRSLGGIVRHSSKYEAPFEAKIGDDGRFELRINPERVARAIEGMDQQQAQAWIDRATEEEIIHLASFEAVSREYEQANGRKPSSLELQAAVQAEYARVEKAMTPEQRAFVKEAYERKGQDNLTGWRMGAEYVRMLAQMDRSQLPTEATIRNFVERILQVLSDLLNNQSTWSPAIDKAYNDTRRVLSEIDAKIAEQAPQQAPAQQEPTVAPPAEQPERKPAAEKKPAAPKIHIIPVTDKKEKPPQKTAEKQPTPKEKPKSDARVPNRKKSKASEALKQQGRDAFKGLFAAQPDAVEISIYHLNPRNAVKNKQQVQVVAEDLEKNGWSDRRPLVGVRWSDDEVQLLTGSHRLAAARQAELETIPVVIVEYDELKDAFTDDVDTFSFDVDSFMNLREEDQESDLRALGFVAAADLMEIENESNYLEDKSGLRAPEPSTQEPLPADRLVQFVQLAQNMIKEGINTPNDLALYLDDISEGRARRYSQALWDALGMVNTQLRGTHNWNEIYAAIDADATVTDTETDETAPTPPPIRDERPEDAPAGDQGSPESGDVDSESTSPELAGDLEDGVPDDASGAKEGGDSGDVRGTTSDRRGEGSDAERSGDERAPERTPSGKRPNKSGGRKGVASGSRPSTRTGGGERPATSPGRPNYHLADPRTIIGGSGPKARFARNLKALETYDTVRAEGRDPTPEEMDAMASYIGWGSFGQELFRGTWERPNVNAEWQQESEQLRELLGEQGWKSARASIINAHYTDPPTVNAIWNIVERLGFKGGRVLEPSVGIGTFFGMMPRETMAKSDLTAIELDSVVGGMAKMLYPQANVQIKGYQDSKTADNFYDLVIGNWPFFEKGPSDRRYNHLKPSLHDYFFLKALDQVRPGGFVIGITSSGTMDKRSAAVRRKLAQNGELIASFRLPSGAFQGYAGTNVVTDLIVLRKRMEPITDTSGEKWIQTAEIATRSGEKINVNQFYIDNPNMVLGELNYGHGTTFGRAGMIVERPDNYERLLAQIPQRVPENAFQEWKPANSVAYMENVDQNRRQNSVVAVEKGKSKDLYIVQGEQLARLNDIRKWKLKSASDTAARYNEAKAAIEIADALEKLLHEQRRPNSNTTQARIALRTAYDKFVAEFGPVSESRMLELFIKAGDPRAKYVTNLEKRTKSGQIETAAIMDRDIMRKPVVEAEGSIEDAYIFSRNDSVGVDLDRIAEISKKPKQEVIDRLVELDQIFQRPDGVWEAREEYLADNVRRKLREAEDAKAQGMDMDRNIAALEAIIPKNIPYSEIEVRLGAAWVHESDYHQFISDLMNTPVEDFDKLYRLTHGNSGWSFKVKSSTVSSSSQSQSVWGTKSADFNQTFMAAINGVPAIITKEVENEKGNKVRVIDEKATEAANNKVDAIKEEFESWIWRDAERTARLAAEYNEVQNSDVVPRRDGSHLRFPGLALNYGTSEFEFRKHQKDAVWRGIQDRRGMYFHEVGTGKTFTMAGLAMEGKRLGIMRKTMIFAHNANSKEVAADMNVAYPGAKVLYVDNLAPDNRDNALRQIALDDWDVVVLPHSLINRLTLREETLRALAQEEIDRLEAEMYAEIEDLGVDASKIAELDFSDSEDLKKANKLFGRREGAHTAKQLVKMRFGIEESIKKSAAQAAHEGAIFFEDLGIDAIMVDEAHIFKKVALATRKQIKGLNKEKSNRSWALSALTSYVKSQNNGKNVFLFTGTPLTNNLNEAYNMQQYIMDDVMQEKKVRSFDDWFNMYASADTGIELNVGGEFEPVTRLSSFVNVPELARLTARYFDVVLAKDMPEFTPRASEEGMTEDPKGRPFKQVRHTSLQMSPQQKAHAAEIRQRLKTFNSLSADAKRKVQLDGGDTPLRMENESANVSLDYRLHDKDAEDFEGSKVNTVVKGIVEYSKHHEKATQMVFMSRGFNDYSDRVKTTTNPDTGEKTVTKTRVEKFNLVRDLVEKLVAQGFKPEEIAVFSNMQLASGRKDDVLRNVKRVSGKTTKQDLAHQMREGKIRIGIGSIQTMGTGVNAQDYLRAIWHMDAPWTPGELDQANGRGWRQGNKWNTVYEHRMYSEQGYDGRRWGVVLKKASFINQFTEMLLDANAGTGKRVLEGEGADLSEAEGNGSDLEESFSQALGDPRVMVRANLAKDIEKLERRRDTHLRARREAGESAREAQRNIVYNEQILRGRESDLAQYRSESEKPFSITILGKTYTDKKAAEKAMNAMPTQTKKGVIGEYKGFEINFDPERSGFAKNYDYMFALQGKHEYQLGKFSIAAMEANLRRIPSYIEDLKSHIEQNRRAIKSLREMQDQPFSREQELADKKERLEVLDAELLRSPKTAPAWLRNGAPTETQVFIEGEPFDVIAHRWDNNGYWILVDDKGTIRPIDYRIVRDKDGNKMFEEQEFERPDGTTGDDGQVSEETGPLPDSVPSNAAEINDEAQGLQAPAPESRTPQTETPAFKRWFGDSKVVDADGKPLVVYHGTDAGDLTEFDTRDRSLEIIKNSLGENIGTFFAANKNHAKDFGGHIIPVYLSLQNPAVFKSQVDFREFMREHSGRTEDIRDDEGFIIEEGQFQNRMRETLEAQGYDGVVIKRPGYTKSKSSDRSWFIAFRPEQIKSATGNRGTFDPNDPNILRAPQPEQADDPRAGVLLSAYRDLPDNERKILALKAQGVRDAQIARQLKMTPQAMAAAYQSAIGKLNKARAMLEAFPAMVDKAMNEKKGERTIGRPDLANVSKGTKSRRLESAVDEARKQSGTPSTLHDQEVIKEAQARLRKDYNKERENIIRRAETGASLDPYETVIAKTIVARESLSAIRSRSTEKMLEFAKIFDVYRITGTEQARAFRLRADWTKSPAERAIEYIAKNLLTPPQRVTDKIDREKDLEKRERDLANWTKRVNKVKARLKAIGLDLDVMTDEQIIEFLKQPGKPRKVAGVIADTKKDFWDALYEWWLSSILSNPATQVANIVGNTANAFWDFTAQRFMESSVNLATGNLDGAQFGEFKYLMKGILPGLSQGAKNFLTSYRDETTVFQESVLGEDGRTKLEYEHGRAIPGKAGKVIRTPLRLLQAVDEMSKTLFAHMQVGAEAYRIAKREKLSGDAMAKRIDELTRINPENPSQAWINAASKSVELTFQQEMGPAGKWMNATRRRFRPLNYVVPFVQTPVNIFKTGLRKSPLGTLPLLYRLSRAGLVKLKLDKSGWTYTKNDFAPQFAEQILAWVGMLAIAALVAPDDDGIPWITGTIPFKGTNRGERDLAYRTAPPMSIRIGGRWYSYARIEPAAVMISSVVDLFQSKKEYDHGADATAVMGKTFTRFMGQFKEKTFMRGISDILNAVEDGQSVVDWAGNFATSWVPNIIRAGARNTDDVLREQKVWGQGDEWSQSFVEALKYKALPFANDIVQPKVDLWGRDITKTEGASPQTDWLARMFSISATKDHNPNMLDRLIVNWNNQNPEQSIAPAVPAPFWRIKQPGDVRTRTYYMSREEYHTFLVRSGIRAAQALERRPLNVSNPTDKDIKEIQKALAKARRDVRQELWKERQRKALQ